MKHRTLAVSIAAAACLTAGVEGLICWKVLEKVRVAHRGEAAMQRFAVRAKRLNRAIYLEEQERDADPSLLAGRLPTLPR